MSKNRLLSDEELREKINLRFESVTSEGHQRSCGEYQTAVDDVMEMFHTQKRLFAESVIGEDETKPMIPQTEENIPVFRRVPIRNNLRAEQRARIK